MYRTCDQALDAFRRCLTLNMFPNLCGNDCPYADPAGNECGLTTIIDDLREIITCLPALPPLAEKVLPVMSHCNNIDPGEYCEQKCPYYSQCCKDNPMPLLHDIRDVLTSAGLLKTESY